MTTFACEIHFLKSSTDFAHANGELQ